MKVTEAKQINSNYHILYNMIEALEDYDVIENKKEILSTIKQLFNEYSELKNNINNKGQFGIEYYTIHDDSSYADKYTQFFTNEKERDNVFDDWNNDRYWDNIFQQELNYRTPGSNFHNPTKIVRLNGEIYKK